jgi:hypothetical protein
MGLRKIQVSKQKQIRIQKWQWKNNEGKFDKIVCSKKNLETRWKHGKVDQKIILKQKWKMAIK